ncbi:MAG: hypothetical protein MUF58_05360 [Arcicella sp.]|nr:hypothetical protein [Arcicella sp.]
MNKEKIIAFLKHFLVLIFTFYAIDWFMSVGYKLLKGADFTMLNNQYHFKWTWIGVAIGISYFRVKSEEK